MSPESRQFLLQLARQALRAAVLKQPLPVVSADTPPELVQPENRGAFVTLTKGKMLRGCIGLLESNLALAETIIRMAAAAALQDPRFRPVLPAEVDSISLEISVLSPLRQVASADEIVLGRDGVLVEYAGRTGVFLPQVAQETGWDRERFLCELCSSKACIPEFAWKESDACLYTFTAEIIHE
jgi:AmmeMemoRadiSam system protein A